MQKERNVGGGQTSVHTRNDDESFVCQPCGATVANESRSTSFALVITLIVTVAMMPNTLVQAGAFQIRVSLRVIVLDHFFTLRASGGSH